MGVILLKIIIPTKFKDLKFINVFSLGNICMYEDYLYSIDEVSFRLFSLKILSAKTNFSLSTLDFLRSLRLSLLPEFFTQLWPQLALAHSSLVPL